ncbi:hypothetical protein DPSP01_000155 [Paraphaeosphaeria sporulosa]
MVINLYSDEYSNLQKPHEQSGAFICDHEGDCGAECPCRLNKTTCREACKCPSTCPHRFPYCECEKVCTTGCRCIGRGRECVPGKCRNGKCVENGQRKCRSFFPRKAHDCLWVGKSTIPYAGNGLFTRGDIKAHECLGRYTGTILPDAEIECNGKTVMTAFAVAKDMSIQGIHPSNWLYWVNHPPRDKKANAEFRMIEGASGRFVVLMPTRRINKGEEVFANYAADFAGFPEPSEKQSHVLCEQELKKNDDYSVGEYILVFGICEVTGDHHVWVGKIAKKYHGDQFGVHWLYHPSQLPEADNLELPRAVKLKTQQFDPWELIISEEGSIVDRSIIMSRYEGMIERAALKRKEQGFWWWDWVIRYRAVDDPITGTKRTQPFMVTSRDYFRKRKRVSNWDIVARAQEMGLQPIKPIKMDNILVKEERTETLNKAETTVKKSKRTTRDALEKNELDTHRAKRQRQALQRSIHLRSRTRDTDDEVSQELFDDEDDHHRALPARTQRNRRSSQTPSTAEDLDEENQSRNETSNARVAQDPIPSRLKYALRSTERSHVYEYDEVSDVDEELQYLFVDHDEEESEEDAPDTREDEMETPDLVDGDTDSAFPTAVTPMPAPASGPGAIERITPELEWPCTFIIQSDMLRDMPRDMPMDKQIGVPLGIPMGIPNSPPPANSSRRRGPAVPLER